MHDEGGKAGMEYSPKGKNSLDANKGAEWVAWIVEDHDNVCKTVCKREIMTNI